MSLGIQSANLIEKRQLNIESLMLDGNTGYAQTLPFESIVIDPAIERKVRGRAQVSVGERKPAHTMIPCHNNEGVRMASLKFQGLAHGFVEGQDLLQHGTRVVRMPAGVDTSSFHEHKETVIAPRQDVDRVPRS